MMAFPKGLDDQKVVANWRCQAADSGEEIEVMPGDWKSIEQQES